MNLFRHDCDDDNDDDDDNDNDDGPQASRTPDKTF